MSTVLTVIKKELKRFFTDKRMLLTLILPGILIYIMYSLMGTTFEESFTADSEYQYQVYIVNNPSDETYNMYFEQMFEMAELDVVIEGIEEDQLDEYKSKITNKEIDLIVYYEEDFLNKVYLYDSNNLETSVPLVEVFFNSVEIESYTIYQFYVSTLNAFESSLNNKFDINLSGDIYDLATDEEKSASIITQMLPMLLVLLLFSGCMAISTESIAGEKERGTIATLLVTPIKRSHLAFGKIIALSIVSLVGAVSSYLGLMLSFPKLMSGSGVSINIYGVSEYLVIFFLIITLVLLFTVALSILSTYAKSVKESQQLAMPLMIVVMLCGISTMIGLTSDSLVVCFIPVYNAVICLSDVLGLNINIFYLLMTIVVNLIYVGVGVYVLKRMFDSEKIMFNK